MHYLNGWRKAFDYAGVATRSEYWTFTLVNLLIVLIAGASGVKALATLAGVLILASLVPGVALNARRLHDAGFSGWMQLLGFIPLVLLIFMLLPSKTSNNVYRAGSGRSETVGRSSGVIVLAVVGVGLVVALGIVAAIAVPAYQDYVVRARAVSP
jgi:uncharacterized membrane protein YhaH (DUF805 family)